MEPEYTCTRTARAACGVSQGAVPPGEGRRGAPAGGRPDYRSRHARPRSAPARGAAFVTGRAAGARYEGPALLPHREQRPAVSVPRAPGPPSSPRATDPDPPPPHALSSGTSRHPPLHRDSGSPGIPLPPLGHTAFPLSWGALCLQLPAMSHFPPATPGTPSPRAAPAGEPQTMPSRSPLVPRGCHRQQLPESPREFASSHPFSQRSALPTALLVGSDTHNTFPHFAAEAFAPRLGGISRSLRISGQGPVAGLGSRGMVWLQQRLAGEGARRWRPGSGCASPCPVPEPGSLCGSREGFPALWEEADAAESISAGGAERRARPLGRREPMGWSVTVRSAAGAERWVLRGHDRAKVMEPQLSCGLGRLFQLESQAAPQDELLGQESVPQRPRVKGETHFWTMLQAAAASWGRLSIQTGSNGMQEPEPGRVRTLLCTTAGMFPVPAWGALQGPLWGHPLGRGRAGLQLPPSQWQDSHHLVLTLNPHAGLAALQPPRPRHLRRLLAASSLPSPAPGSCRSS